MDDMVPRLGIHAAQSLQRRLSELDWESKAVNDAIEVVDVASLSMALPDTTQALQLWLQQLLRDSLRSPERSDDMTSQSSHATVEQQFVPGRVLFISRHNVDPDMQVDLGDVQEQQPIAGSFCSSKRQQLVRIEVQEVDRASETLGTIEISRRLLSDHFPYYIIDALGSICDEKTIWQEAIGVDIGRSGTLGNISWSSNQHVTLRSHPSMLLVKPVSEEETITPPRDLDLTNFTFSSVAYGER